jgi:hypothetical protein
MGTAQAAARNRVEFAKAVRVRQQSLAPKAAKPDERLSAQKKRHAGPELSVCRNDVFRRRQPLVPNAEAVGPRHRQKYPAPRRDPHPRRKGKDRQQICPAGPECRLRPGVPGQHLLAGPQDPDGAPAARRRDKGAFVVGRGLPQPCGARAEYSQLPGGQGSRTGLMRPFVNGAG